MRQKWQVTFTTPPKPKPRLCKCGQGPATYVHAVLHYAGVEIRDEPLVLRTTKDRQIHHYGPKRSRVIRRKQRQRGSKKT